MLSPGELYARIDSAGNLRVGPRTSTTATDHGSSTYALIDDDPQGLADAAGLDLSTYALARMIASENGRASAATILATGECARNKAAQRGETVAELLLNSTMTGLGGKFAEQAAGRWASTRLDPLGRHVEAARVVMEGSQVFAGAVDFFDPHSQDARRQGGHALRQTSEGYITARASEGLSWVGPLADVDAYNLMVFAKFPKPIDTGPAMGVLIEGRGRGTTIVADAVASVVGDDTYETAADAVLPGGKPGLVTWALVGLAAMWLLT